MAKKILLASWLIVLFSGIFLLFWYNEWIYSLHTPVPRNYHAVKRGTHVELPAAIYRRGQPLFIHFFNPSCPCSKFNLPYFASIAKKYSRNISFVMVVLNKKKNEYTEDQVRKKAGLNIPVLFDESLAGQCGVYSTPQAVIIDGESRLYYRGNYNRSRYCTDKSSNYAEMAIDSLLADNRRPVFATAALQAYGCKLPGCTQ